MFTLDFSPENCVPCRVTGWIHANLGNDVKQRKHPAVIICPGGGYRRLSSREAEPVAERYYASGYNTFILYYSVGDKAKDFIPLIQLNATIANIRRNSENWFTLPNKIAVLGFSAGGHLACSSGTLANTHEFASVLGDAEPMIPNALILCYPVITVDENTHGKSIELVSNSRRGSERYNWFGLDKHVCSKTPPTFLWHTSADVSVPVENSLSLAMALSKEKVPFEMHIFPDGAHGMSVCTQEVGSLSKYNARWVDMSIHWLNTLFDYTY